MTHKRLIILPLIVLTASCSYSNLANYNGSIEILTDDGLCLNNDDKSNLKSELAEELEMEDGFLQFSAIGEIKEKVYLISYLQSGSEIGFASYDSASDKFGILEGVAFSDCFDVSYDEKSEITFKTAQSLSDNSFTFFVGYNGLKTLCSVDLDTYGISVIKDNFGDYCNPDCYIVNDAYVFPKYPCRLYTTADIESDDYYEFNLLESNNLYQCGNLTTLPASVSLTVSNGKYYAVCGKSHGLVGFRTHYVFEMNYFTKESTYIAMADVSGNIVSVNTEYLK